MKKVINFNNLLYFINEAKLFKTKLELKNIIVILFMSINDLSFQILIKFTIIIYYICETL